MLRMSLSTFVSISYLHWVDAQLVIRNRPSRRPEQVESESLYSFDCEARNKGHGVAAPGLNASSYSDLFTYLGLYPRRASHCEGKLWHLLQPKKTVALCAGVRRGT